MDIETLSAYLPPMFYRQLLDYVRKLEAENIRLQDKLETVYMEGEFQPDPMAAAYRLADIILNSGIQCIFCDESDATTYTSSGDFVCETCRDEFESALEGDTE